MRERSNDEWLAALRGPKRDDALAELRVLLVSGLRAALGGMPLEAIADRMGTNRNALYKLLYDARKRLKRRMVAEDLLPRDVLGALEG